MNLLNVVSIILIFLQNESYNNNSSIVIILQLVISVIFIIEYLIYLKKIGFKKLCRMYLRTLFLIVNISIIIIHSIILIYDMERNFKIQFVKIGIIIRFLRIKFLLDTFNDFNLIFTVLDHLSISLLPLIGTIWSFFYIFSSVTMLIVGGKIKNDSFNNDRKIFLIIAIPIYYYHVNFNDFGYSYLTCFALLMVNNMNVVSEAISSTVGFSTQSYFTVFYFIACILILNILHSYILDMYVNIKKSRDNNEN